MSKKQRRTLIDMLTVTGIGDVVAANPQIVGTECPRPPGKCSRSVTESLKGLGEGFPPSEVPFRRSAGVMAETGQQSRASRLSRVANPAQNPWPGCHVAAVYGPRMEVAELAHLRRARDLLDREYARPLDVPAMARAALMSPSLFSRRFREAYRDTPYGYLQARRVERAMALLRRGHMSVTDVCMAVGFTSLGSFSSTFTRLVGEPPSVYKARDHSRLTRVPPCMTHAWARPGWVAQPCRIGEAFLADRA